MLNHGCVIMEPLVINTASNGENHCPAALNFPSVNIPYGESLSNYFRRVTINGLLNRLIGASSPYEALNCSDLLARLDKEQQDLAAIGFLTYFLVAADVVAHIKQDTPVPLRFGDWRHSVTAFALGIADTRPSRRITMERPLSACPLLTLGYGGGRRRELLDYCSTKYGQDCVAIALDPYGDHHPTDIQKASVTGFVVSASALTANTQQAMSVEDYLAMSGDEVDLSDSGLIIYRLPSVLATSNGASQ